MRGKAAKQNWDVWGIKAELGRRGITFKAMAKESGFSASSLYAALAKPSTNVNTYIAVKLGVPLHVLWPDWFDEDVGLIPAKMRGKPSRQRADSASHESQPEGQAA